MFLHVIEARYVQNYIVWLRFNDGTEGEVDLSAELEGPVFGALRDSEAFKAFHLAHHTRSWENGADFAPAFLHEQVRAAA